MKVQRICAKIIRNCTRHGDVRFIQDEETKSKVLLITAINVATCYITTPKSPTGSLGIRLPIFVMIIENLNQYLSFVITILDDMNIRRRFRFCNYVKDSKIDIYSYSAPLCLNRDWNQLIFDLEKFTENVFQTKYFQTIRIQIHANCKLRRIYFCDKVYDDNSLPKEYRVNFAKIVGQKTKNIIKWI
ncbi:uncharacterized protein LOC126898235 [Daktulosphaira vitifoliae]|uniref:uncharacterized protein LOC126898235 n=1 Tax=Daktulosphaira vitifoliae TaxID=58002 RepID=UPI0021AACF0B|nr:uncharacterized protein LOC126898235 [Daktulosphaira vitifoliae]